jgi:hypothetical protein
MTRLFAVFTIASACVVSAEARTAPTQPKQSPTSRSSRESQKVYEDHEIEVAIPTGWKIPPLPKEMSPKSANDAPRTLALEKDGYTLRLAYHTAHASGIEGGRLIEAINIAWGDVDDAGTCGGFIQEEPQPASRSLMFVNLTIDSSDPKAREVCAIQEDLGFWTVIDGMKMYDGYRRWVGGYFRTLDGGYFFGGDSDGCGLKSYTLTSQATAPDRLPIPDNPRFNNNPALQKIIQEAIDIVGSVRYKRCSPW